ncbi:MAG: radical SAM-associated putative lipoprotein [Candidatus Symbiothrix sp.]|jgi:putative lipoprotein (rSAM/lipoprotein system)|nr:radical SAM-associated putative lipoprotein [Candidatus Symbiothrix sp.]
MKIKRAVIKGTNWALAGLIGLLGFTNCDDVKYGREEYGTPTADYTVKGAVVDKKTGKPIPGIRVAYSPDGAMLMYGVTPTPYKEKASVTTNAKGEYKLTEKSSFEEILPVYVSDIDGDQNGLYRDTVLTVNFKDAVRSGKPQGWYVGEYTVNMDVELTEWEGNE